MTRNRILRPAVVLAVLTLVLTACDLYAPGTPRPYWCDPTDTAVNDGMTPSFDAVYSTPKGPLSMADCRQLTFQIVAAQSFASQYPTVADVTRAGWIQAAVWDPGQGVHYVDPSRITGPFDPQRPNWLMYDGTAPTSKLAGMMFLVSSGSRPPAGFPGGNDQWHQHGPLCNKANAVPFIVGENMSDAACAALGGVNVNYSSLWMVHVWLPEYAGWQATDIFNMTNPMLGDMPMS